MALATSNCCPLSRGFKLRLSARGDGLPDAGRRFRIDSRRDLYDISPHTMYLPQSQRTEG